MPRPHLQLTGGTVFSIGSSVTSFVNVNWLQQVEETLAYLLVLPGSRARIVRCGGRYDPQLVKRSSE